MESLPQAADTVGVRVPGSARRARRGEASEASRTGERVRGHEPGRESGSAHDLDLIPRARSERVSRAVNFALALIGIIILLPLLILIAIAVKLTSRGPIFYTQTRVGMDRRWKRTLAIHEKRVQD